MHRQEPLDVGRLGGDERLRVCRLGANLLDDVVERQLRRPRLLADHLKRRRSHVCALQDDVVPRLVPKRGPGQAVPANVGPQRDEHHVRSQLDDPLADLGQRHARALRFVGRPLRGSLGVLGLGGRSTRPTRAAGLAYLAYLASLGVTDLLLDGVRRGDHLVHPLVHDHATRVQLDVRIDAAPHGQQLERHQKAVGVVDRIVRERPLRQVFRREHLELLVVEQKLVHLLLQLDVLGRQRILAGNLLLVDLDVRLRLLLGRHETGVVPVRLAVHLGLQLHGELLIGELLRGQRLAAVRVHVLGARGLDLELPGRVAAADTGVRVPVHLTLQLCIERARRDQAVVGGPELLQHKRPVHQQPLPGRGVLLGAHLAARQVGDNVVHMHVLHVVRGRNRGVHVGRDGDLPGQVIEPLLVPLGGPHHRVARLGRLNSNAVILQVDRVPDHRPERLLHPPPLLLLDGRLPRARRVHHAAQKHLLLLLLQERQRLQRLTVTLGIHHRKVVDATQLVPRVDRPAGPDHRRLCDRLRLRRDLLRPERANEQTSKRANEQTSERASERVRERTSERLSLLSRSYRT